MFGNQRDDIRKFYFAAWQKYQGKQVLSALEQQIVAVMVEHPEYHSLFDSPDQSRDRDFLPEMGQTNPFLHLGLHLGIREQVSMNQPLGIADVFTQLRAKHGGDHLAAEHLMMDCLAEQLWLAQRESRMPDEQSYLSALRELLQQ